MPTRDDITYFTGFFDGEGSISLNRDGRSFGLAVTVSNCDIGVLNWVVDTFGGTLHEKVTRNHRRQYFVKWSGQQAKNLILLMLPHLKIKTPQAKLALLFRNLVQTNATKLSNEALLKRTRYANWMSLLNKGMLALDDFTLLIDNET